MQMINTMTRMRQRHRPAAHRKSVSCSEHVEGIADLEGGTRNHHEQWRICFCLSYKEFLCGPL